MKNESEVWFEGYLLQEGYGFTHEPSLGSDKKPDYEINRGDSRAICEVKEFEALGFIGRLFAGLGDEQPGTMKKLLDPVRGQIKSAAKQLKPYQNLGVPLIVVLANPKKAGVNLKDEFVISAMYGDLQVSISAGLDGKPTSKFVVGLNGQLTNSHQYLSAVVVVEKHESFEDESLAFVNDLYAANPLIIPRKALRKLKRRQKKLGTNIVTYSCRVFETGGANAVHLPANIFDSSKDSRWINSGGGMTKVK